MEQFDLGDFNGAKAFSLKELTKSLEWSKKNEEKINELNTYIGKVTSISLAEIVIRCPDMALVIDGIISVIIASNVLGYMKKEEEDAT